MQLQGQAGIDGKGRAEDSEDVKVNDEGNDHEINTHAQGDDDIGDMALPRKSHGEALCMIARDLVKPQKETTGTRHSATSAFSPGGPPWG
jgi:hypothetical protein